MARSEKHRYFFFRLKHIFNENLYEECFLEGIPSDSDLGLNSQAMGDFKVALALCLSSFKKSQKGATYNAVSSFEISLLFAGCIKLRSS